MIRVYSKSLIFDERDIFRLREFDVVDRFGGRRKNERAQLRAVVVKNFASGKFYAYFLERKEAENSKDVAGKVFGTFETKFAARQFIREKVKI